MPRFITSITVNASIAVLSVMFSSIARAHDIPNDVTVQAFLKPYGDRAHLLVRVPLKAMRGLEFPEKASGYLDLERVAPILPDAAVLWISDFIELYEGD